LRNLFHQMLLCSLQMVCWNVLVARDM
jgi:hypothetical protein